MKIICTEDEKEWLFPLLLNSDCCPAHTDCKGRTCEQCLSEEIEWVIEPETEAFHRANQQGNNTTSFR